MHASSLLLFMYLSFYTAYTLYGTSHVLVKDQHFTVKKAQSSKQSQTKPLKPSVPPLHWTTDSRCEGAALLGAEVARSVSRSACRASSSSASVHSCSVVSWRPLFTHVLHPAPVPPLSGGSGGALTYGDVSPPPSAAALKGVVCPQLLRSARGKQRPLGYCQ